MKRKNNRLKFDTPKRKDGLNFRRKRRKINFDKLRSFFVLFIEICVTVAFAYLLVMCFGKQVVCNNESMEPTIANGQTSLVNTVAYKLKTPERGDLIAFKPKSNVNASYTIKRVIAIPGDTIVIKNGRVYVNDEVLKESQKAESIENPGIVASEIVLSEDQYFVLGDNRNNSEDSRYESIGFVSMNDILGKIWANSPF